MGNQPTETQPAPFMQELIASLAAKHGADLSQTGVSLTLRHPRQSNQLLLYNAGTGFVVLAYLCPEADCQFLPEVEVLFCTGAPGWQLVEIRYAPEVWAAYIGAIYGTLDDWDDRAAGGKTMLDAVGAYWASRLIEEGWLAEGQACVRISGCQSTNHDHCYGELWPCAACHRTFCCAEGTDNHPELCDDCWAARFAPEVVEHTPRITFTEEGTLELLCDCPELCGAWLELTADGVLALEDQDGLRVSLLLPEWLDDAIRQAAARQQAALPKIH